jgi:hypothetical protein
VRLPCIKIYGRMSLFVRPDFLVAAESIPVDEFKETISTAGQPDSVANRSATHGNPDIRRASKSESYNDSPYPLGNRSSLDGSGN